MSAPTVLRVSGEEVNANISDAVDVSQLCAMVAVALDTFTPCLSLLHDCAPLPKEMLVKDIGAGASILALVNTDMHDLCVELRALDTERSEFRKKTAPLRQMMAHLWQTRRRMSDIDQSLTGLESDLAAYTWSLKEEKQILAQIGKLKQERRHLKHLLAGAVTVHDELCEALRNCQWQLQDQSEDFLHQWVSGGWEGVESLQRALTVSDAIFLRDPEGLKCLGLSEEIFDTLDHMCDQEEITDMIRYDEGWAQLNVRFGLSSHVHHEDSDCGYEDEEYGKDPDGEAHQREKHARHRHGRNTKKAVASVGRFLHPGKVRLRGGRHKVGEQVDVTPDGI